MANKLFFLNKSEVRVAIRFHDMVHVSDRMTF